MYTPFDFDQLYKEARTAVERTGTDWTKFGYDDPKVWEQDFRNGQTDLYWLSTELLGLDLVPEVHRPITDDFFVKKNPYIDARNWKDAVAKQSTVKNRMLLYPRGTFKSSIDGADVVQWILCFPNIRLIYMTAEETLATDFVRQTKSFFQIADDTPLTRFQMLYFMHCVPAKKKEAEDQFLSPARTEKQPQPTILSLSLGMSSAGKHADVGKFDDCVSNKNSGPRATPDQRKAVADEIKLARPIVDLYGYRDYVGTPYDPSDAYTSIQESIPDLKVLIEPAWTVKSGARKKKIDELTEDDVVLLFPVDGAGTERLTFKALMTEYRSDAFIFSCQYMINPQLAKTVKFDEPMLRRQIISPEQFPQPGTYFICIAWDLADTDNKKSDYSVGTVGMFTTEGPLAGRMFIPEIVRGKFGKAELPFQIARLANRWKPVRILGIEDAPGAQFLENDIVRALTIVGYTDCPAIEWIPVDNQKGAKNVRAELVETILVNNELFFSSEIDILDDVVREFVRFKPGTNRKDDAVDSVAHCTRYKPKDIHVPQTEQEKISAAWDVLARKQNHEKQFSYRENELKESGGHWKTDGYDRRPAPPAPPPTHWEGLPIFQHPDHQLYGT